MIALIFTALGCVRYFVGYTSDYNEYYSFGFKLPGFFGLISFLLEIAPPVLLVVYLTKFHKKLRATNIVPVIFGLTAIDKLFTILKSLADYGYLGIFGLIYFILDIVLMIFFTIVMLDALKGMKNKKLIIIAMLIGVAGEIPNILMFFYALIWYISEHVYVAIFTGAMSILGYIGLYISLLLFGVKNEIPACGMGSFVTRVVGRISPEQSLKLLKVKLKFGMITEEEYQAQRAEIISKL